MVTTSDTKERERKAAESFLATGSQEAFRELFEALYAKLVRYFVICGLDMRG